MSHKLRSKLEVIGLAEVIKDIRLKRDLSQNEFAHRLLVTRREISKFERCRALPSFALLMRMCSEFEVDPTWLLGLFKREERSLS